MSRPAAPTTVLVLLTLALPSRGADDAPPAAGGRSIAGRVVDAQGRPVAGATVLFAPQRPRGPSADADRATSDADGRYRVDLGRLPWSRSKLLSKALAPGFAAANGTVEPGDAAGVADFALAPAAWPTTEVRLTDAAARPLAGVEWAVTAVDGQVGWGRATTDAHGTCRVAMAPDTSLTLRAAPAGLRPVLLILANKAGDPATLAIAAPPPVTGRVVDPAGRPVAGAIVGRMIVPESVARLQASDPGPDRGAMAMLPHFYAATATTDLEGRFKLLPVLMSRPIDRENRRPNVPIDPICVAAPGFERVAFQIIDFAKLAGPVEVTLPEARLATIPVQPGVMTAAGGGFGLSLEFFVLADPNRPEIRLPFQYRWFACPEAGRGEVQLPLPPGRFFLAARATNAPGTEVIGQSSSEVVVPDVTGPLTLDPIRLDPPNRFRDSGRPAPEIEATDLDTGAPVLLADWRGRVVLLDFWGSWCGPCVGAMPDLIAVQEHFRDRPVTVLALHDESAADRAEYDRRVASARANLWGGRDLPFRVLLDRPDPARGAEEERVGRGATVARYKVGVFPTLLVIDQAGKLVGWGSARDRDRLQTLVQGLLDRPPPP